MRPLPPGLPPHIATHAINLQQTLSQQQALHQLDLSQQNRAPGQPNLATPVFGHGPNGLNGVVEIVRGLRIAFIAVRLVIVVAVLWMMWHTFAPY